MYEVQLPVFQGPLELLLHLIEKRQLDITTLSLVEVTEQYMERVRAAEQIDLASLADFLVVGAKLLYIKSVSLLPRPPVQEPELEEDPGAELTRLLEEYRKFRDVAKELREKEEGRGKVYPRLAPPPKPEARPAPLELTLPELIGSVEKILRRMNVQEIPAVERRTVTIVDRVTVLRARLTSGAMLTFSSFVADCTSREAVVVSLLSLLELIKAKEVEAQQEALFGEIYIYPFRVSSVI